MLGSRRGIRCAGPFGVLLELLLGAILAGCSGSEGIPNLAQSSPPLPAMATYDGPRMNDPRYGHTATVLENGSILVVGGSDELHLTALDTVEIFDPAGRVDVGESLPESIAGDFIDQDIDGDIIDLPSGGRFFHSATAIADGQVLVIGGTNSILYGISIGTSEIFDPHTRRFEAGRIDPTREIQVPRARHGAIRLAGGRVLVTGGQEAVSVVVPGPGGSGGAGQQAREARPSTERIEVFDPASLAFTDVLDYFGNPAELTSARGRAGHTVAQWAGFDGILNNGDDLYGILGGFMTYSAISLAAPEDYLPWSPQTTKLTSMDYFDPTTGTVNLASGLTLARRVNDPIAINLGADHSTTPFGEPGVTNAVLILGGDSDETCPAGAPANGMGTTDHAELVIASFTGFGPAGGVRFAKAAAGVVNGSSTFANGHELAVLGPPCREFNRSRGGAVRMGMVREIEGTSVISSVVVAGGGIAVSRQGGCSAVGSSFCGEEVQGFQFFDPFFDIASVGSTLPLVDDLDGDLTPDLFPWDWRNRGTVLNPLGLRGTTLHYDAEIPSGGIAGYADGSATVSLGQPRALFTLSRIPGEDGLAGSLDDRIVAIGGTSEYWPSFGADPLSISCEIFLPPDAGSAP